MLDFQQKRKVRSVIYSRVTIGILLVLVVVVLHSTWVVYQKKRESEQMKNLSLQRVLDLRTRDLELQARIERLGTTPGLEEEIRSKFSVAKDKETMIIVVPEEETKASTTPAKLGIWQKIWSFFGL